MHIQPFWWGRGIGLHSSTTAKRIFSNFGGERVSDYVWSAILEGRGYRITLFHACKNAWSALLEGKGYQVTFFHACKNA